VTFILSVFCFSFCAIILSVICFSFCGIYIICHLFYRKKNRKKKIK
jgi:4-hydroxybenzoate polyprenyltransferase